MEARLTRGEDGVLTLTDGGRERNGPRRAQFVAGGAEERAQRLSRGKPGESGHQVEGGSETERGHVLSLRKADARESQSQSAAVTASLPTRHRAVAKVTNRRRMFAIAPAPGEGANGPCGAPSHPL